MSTPKEGYCNFFNEKKKKFCPFQTKSGEIFCSQHIQCSLNSNNQFKSRIPCPLDPHHTIIEDQLEKHILICNAGKKEIEQQPYYQKSVNLAPNISRNQKDELQEDEKIISQQQVALKVFTALIHILDGSGQENLCPEVFVSSTQFDSIIQGLTPEQRAQYVTREKHLKQQSSLIEHAQRLGLLYYDSQEDKQQIKQKLNKKQNLYIEFGAGKGGLSHSFHIVSEQSQFILIEKESRRCVQDRLHRTLGKKQEQIFNEINDKDNHKDKEIENDDSEIYKIYNNIQNEKLNEPQTCNHRKRRRMDDDEIHIPIQEIKSEQNTSIENEKDANQQFTYEEKTTHINILSQSENILDQPDRIIKESKKRKRNELEYDDNSSDIDEICYEQNSYDNKISQDQNMEENKTQGQVSVNRLKIDIGDIILSNVEQIRNQINIGHYKINKDSQNCGNIVAIGKHVCGGATDITLRSLYNFKNDINTLKRNKLRDDESHEISKIENIQGLLISSCCHHRCTWQQYINQQFMIEHKIEENDFILICKMASWAVSGERTDKTAFNWEQELTGINEDIGKQQQENQETINSSSSYQLNNNIITLFKRISPSLGINQDTQSITMQMIGRACKLLIDLGRVFWMQENLFQNQKRNIGVLRYCPSSITPENVLLYASAEDTQSFQ